MRGGPGRALAFLALPWLLGGCTLLEAGASGDVQPTVDVAQRQQRAVTELAATASYAQTLSMLEPESRRQELAEAEDRFRDDPTDSNRIRLALALSFVDEEWQDSSRAVAMLNEVSWDSELVIRGNLVRLLRVMVAELEQARQQQAAVVQEQVLVAQQQPMSDEERARCEALEEQLNRLKEIERQINERSQPSPLPIDDE